jgi:hypothetical protein
LPLHRELSSHSSISCLLPLPSSCFAPAGHPRTQ